MALLVGVKIMSIILLLFISGGLVSAGRVEEVEREGDRVTELPGQPAVNFPHYAGYVKLNPPNEQKALFYWFFQAQHNSSQKPVMIWLNGGPGCSSIASGAAREHGPFLLRANGTLILNQFSWNKVANMLYFEAPIGVGFSYTNKSTDFDELGDRVTAEDSYDFLIQWFKRFPSFKSNEFYLAGQSYAGHYVPQLADLIHKKNSGASKDSVINLKGIMIGSPALDDKMDGKGVFEYAWNSGIISNRLYHGLVKDCDPRIVGLSITNVTTECAIHILEILGVYSQIDVYSIYTPVCVNSFNATPSKPAASPRLAMKHEFGHDFDPCTQDYVVKYFNRKDVQRALHANLTNLPYPYTPCNTPLLMNWNDSPETVLPIIQGLLNAGLRVLVYGGDTDGRIPVMSTRYSINTMNLTVKEEWRSWYHKGQVAGWVEVYHGGLTLATVRGAGHQAPVLRPGQSLSLISHFLSSATLPASRF